VGGKKVKRALLAAIILLPGCVGLGSRESSVTYPDGRVYRIRCQSDGVVDFTQGDVKVRVDNRGPVSQVWAAATASLGKVYSTAKEAVTKGE
jgi:hypothetical protein